jgi:hypothetical protein
MLVELRLRRKYRGGAKKLEKKHKKLKIKALLAKHTRPCHILIKNRQALSIMMMMLSVQDST